MSTQSRWKKGHKLTVQGLELEVIREIAEDGMGLVWLLKIVDRTVFIVGKIISPNLRFRSGNIEYLNKFVNECRLSLIMTPHPNIATTMSVDLLNDEQYIILMEYVPGINLFDWLRNRRQELVTLMSSSSRTDNQKFWSIILSISIQISNGMQHMHKINIIHRDLKTKNVVLKTTTIDPQGPSPVDINPEEIVVKIVDLGLAKVYNSSENSTEKFQTESQIVESLGTIGIGTPPYSPPEQFGFINADYVNDLRTIDIFSYGIILCELISGERPFDVIARNSEDILNQMSVGLVTIPELKKEYERYRDEFVSNYLKNCSPRIMEIVLRLIEFFPAERIKQSDPIPKTDNDSSPFKKISTSLEIIYNNETKLQFKQMIDNFPLSNSYLLYDSRSGAFSKLGFKQDALTAADTAIELNKTNASSLIGKYLIFANCEEYNDALKYANLAMEKDPNDRMALSSKWSVLYKLGELGDKKRFGEALSTFDKVPEEDLNDLELLTKAKCFQGNEDHVKAIDAFDKILLRDSRNKEAWIGKADSSNKIGDLGYANRYHEAVTAFDKALEIDPSPSDKAIHFNKGIVLMKLGYFGLKDKYLEAIATYATVLEIDSTDKEAMNNKGSCHLKLDDIPKAMECFCKAIDMDRQFALAWNNKGLCYQTLESFGDAIYCYDKCITLDPKNWRGWYNQGRVLTLIKQFTSAIFCYNWALNLERNRSEIWRDKGTAHLNLREFENAVRCYSICINILSKIFYSGRFLPI